VTVQVSDLTVGKAQALGTLSLRPTQVGYASDPLNQNSRAIWASSAGTITVRKYDGTTMAVDVAGATMTPVRFSTAERRELSRSISISR